MYRLASHPLCALLWSAALLVIARPAQAQQPTPAAPPEQPTPRRKIQIQVPPPKGTYACPIWGRSPRECALLFSFGLRERPKKTFLMTGINVGYGRTGDQNALVLGGEASVVRWLTEGDGLLWGGLAFDGLYDFGLGRARTAAGLELGWTFFGAEVQYVHEWGAAGRGPGVRAGLLFSAFGMFDPYVRYSRYLDAASPASKNQLEVGLLVKVPLVWWATYKGKPNLPPPPSLNSMPPPRSSLP